MPGIYLSVRHSPLPRAPAPLTAAPVNSGFRNFASIFQFPCPFCQLCSTHSLWHSTIPVSSPITDPLITIIPLTISTFPQLFRLIITPHFDAPPIPQYNFSRTRLPLAIVYRFGYRRPGIGAAALRRALRRRWPVYSLIAPFAALSASAQALNNRRQAIRPHRLLLAIVPGRPFFVWL